MKIFLIFFSGNTCYKISKYELIYNSTVRDFSDFFSGNTCYKISKYELIYNLTVRDFSDFFQEKHATKFSKYELIYNSTVRDFFDFFSGNISLSPEFHGSRHFKLFYKSSNKPMNIPILMKVVCILQTVCEHQSTPMIIRGKIWTITSIRQ